jgi:hypothetical protein
MGHRRPLQHEEGHRGLLQHGAHPQQRPFQVEHVGHGRDVLILELRALRVGEWQGAVVGGRGRQSGQPFMAQRAEQLPPLAVRQRPVGQASTSGRQPVRGQPE